jgi:hypothetical protein
VPIPTTIDEVKALYPPDQAYQFPADGATITPHVGDVFIVTGTNHVTVVGQDGGCVWPLDNSVVDIDGLDGEGCVRAACSATINSSNQHDGFVKAAGNSTVNSTDQDGGFAWACQNGVLNSTGQQGGQTKWVHNSTGSADSQSGGYSFVLGSAHITETNYQGGVFMAAENSVVDSDHAEAAQRTGTRMADEPSGDEQDAPLTLVVNPPDPRYPHKLRLELPPNPKSCHIVASAPSDAPSTGRSING